MIFLVNLSYFFVWVREGGVGVIEMVEEDNDFLIEVMIVYVFVG